MRHTPFLLRVCGKFYGAGKWAGAGCSSCRLASRRTRAATLAAQWAARSLLHWPPAEDPHRSSLSACNRGCFWCTAEGRLCTPWDSPPWLLQEVRGMDTKGLRRNDKNLVRAAPTGPGSHHLPLVCAALGAVPGPSCCARWAASLWGLCKCSATAGASGGGYARLTVHADSCAACRPAWPLTTTTPVHPAAGLCAALPPKHFCTQHSHHVSQTHLPRTVGGQGLPRWGTLSPEGSAAGRRASRALGCVPDGSVASPARSGLRALLHGMLTSLVVVLSFDDGTTAGLGSPGPGFVVLQR